MVTVFADHYESFLYHNCAFGHRLSPFSFLMMSTFLHLHPVYPSGAVTVSVKVHLVESSRNMAGPHRYTHPSVFLMVTTTTSYIFKVYYYQFLS